jgi:hypothetical protein
MSIPALKEIQSVSATPFEALIIDSIICQQLSLVM